MNVLIVGSQGFLGSNLKQFFAQTPSYQVFTMDVVPDIGATNHFVSDLGEIDQISDKLPTIEVIINASGAASVQGSIDNPINDRELNYLNVKKALTFLSIRHPNTAFVNISSAAVYGNPKDLPIAENYDQHSDPLSPYGKHKKEADELIKKFGSEGLKCASLRLFSCYGIGQRKLLFWDVYHKLKSSSFERLELFGTGQETRDFLHVLDFCSAVQILLEKGDLSGHVYNCASGQERSIKECAEMCLEILAPKAKLVFKGTDRPGDPKRWKADISKISALGFTPETEMKDGLIRYFNWLKK